MSRTGSVQTAVQRQQWLRWVEAITSAPGRRPVLALVTVVPTMALLLVFINTLAPQAMPEVCSTMMALVIAELAVIVRRRRSVTVATG